MITMKYADFAWEMTSALLAIDSPTGFTDNAAAWLKEQFSELGFKTTLTEKGGVLVELGGEGENGLMLAAHTDTLGAMVAEIKGNGRLRLTKRGTDCANLVFMEFLND